jgi:hypothetical protein
MAGTFLEIVLIGAHAERACIDPHHVAVRGVTRGIIVKLSLLNRHDHRTLTSNWTVRTLSLMTASAGIFGT